jgi:glycine/D-amino acid oxidase-like deaminating enzyme
MTRSANVVDVAGIPPTADVVVIGGGIMGLHVARHLAADRAGRVLLLEKKCFGAGESGKSGAILRQHYSHATLIRMARASLFEYRELDARTRGGIGFTNPGMTFVGGPQERAALAGNVELQRKCGVAVELLDAKALRSMEPHARIEDGLVAAHEPEASFVVPHLTLAAVAAEARSAGAELREGVRVVALELDGERRASGVTLADGTRVATRTIVVCGGPWSAALLRAAAIELPLRAVRPEQAFFLPPPALGDRELRRIWADLVHGLYWKHEATGFTRVGELSYDHDADVPDPDRYDEGVSGAFLAGCRERLARRIPDYERSVCWGGVSALYTVTPDAQALIGRVPGHEGVWIVSGFSGHGFKLGPSIGRGVSALLRGSDPAPLDPAFFAPDRFARGVQQTGAYGCSVLG